MACDACARQVVQDAVDGKINRFRASVRLNVSVRTVQRKMKEYRERGERCFEHGNKDREGEDWWNKPLDNPFHLVSNKPFGSNGQPAVHRESHQDGPNRQEQGDLFQAGAGGSEEKRMDWVDGQKIRKRQLAAHMK